MGRPPSTREERGTRPIMERFGKRGPGGREEVNPVKVGPSFG